MKKRGERETDRFRKKLMIPKFEIPECPEDEVKWKNRNHICKRKNTWKIFC